VTPGPRSLRWTEHAVTQLAAIAEYISLDSPVYAEQVVDQVVRRLAQAQLFPELGRVVPELGRADVRELLEVPYRVIYRVAPDAIEVLAVVHARQQLRGLP
jgi:plasmid stabilization system protein ParE